MCGNNIMMHVVCFLSRDIPKGITQEMVTQKEELLHARGTVKASVLEGDPSYPSLTTLSFYNVQIHYTLYQIHARI